MAGMGSSPSTLNMTALTTSNNASVFECWALVPGFTSSSQPGTSGALIMQLGGLANASYSILPPVFNAGRHNAPNVQFVAYLSGLAHITLPNSTDEVYVLGGRDGVIFAADTADLSEYGHLTDYPSGEETTVLQIPTRGGSIPEHTVLHSGPCIPGVEMSKRGLVELD